MDPDQRRPSSRFITALKAPQVKKLVKDGELQLSMFDELNLAEISCEAYPGAALDRLPQPAGGRGARPQALRAACRHRAELGEIKRRVKAGTLQGAARDRPAVGAVLNRYKVKKHFEVNITDDSFTFFASRPDRAGGGA